MDKCILTHVIIITILGLAMSINVSGQERISLSEKHKQKIEEIKDPKKKLLKYRKYYSRDSIKYLRQLNKELKRKSDSVYAMMRRLQDKRVEMKDRLSNSKVGQKVKDAGLPPLTTPGDGTLPNLERVNSPIGRVKAVDHRLMDKGLPMSTNKISQKATDGLNSPVEKAGGKVADIKNEITPYQEYYNQYKDHLNHPDSMQAMVKKVAREELEQAAEKMVEKGKGMAGVGQFQQEKALAEEIRNMPDQRRQKLEQYGDQAFVKEEGKQKGKEKAMEFLAQHQDKMAGIQKKMGKLKRVYSKVENSNDLSTAVKRSSLKGKPFKERLFIGADLQAINLDPVSLDFSPSVGYMFNRKFIMGIGATYRHTFGEYGPNQTTIPENQYALNAFIQHDVIKGFFAFATYEQSNRELLGQNSDGTSPAWVPGFMAGVGKTVNIHPKVNTRMMLLYNFLHEPGESPYKSPWVFRAGFQLKNSK